MGTYEHVQMCCIERYGAEGEVAGSCVQHRTTTIIQTAIGQTSTEKPSLDIVYLPVSLNIGNNYIPLEKFLH